MAILAAARFLVGETRNAPKTRGTYGIRNLFERCAVPVPEYKGQTKVDWAREILSSLADEQLHSVFKQLVSSEENGNEELARVAMISLNAELISHGFQLIQSGDSFKLSRVDSNSARFSAIRTTAYGLSDPGFEQLDLSDEEARRIMIGWEEAVRCYGAGAYLATIVMLGSLLEAILLLALTRNKVSIAANGIRFNDNRNQEKPIEKWSLNEMIDASARMGWITRKISTFAHSLREYRNYVHPELRKRLSELPKSHECLIGSGVISGLVDDLKDIINNSHDHQGAVQ